MKKKVLFIMHIPPPVHGAAIMGKYIFESTLINDEFDCIYINLSASKKVYFYRNYIISRDLVILC